MRCQWKLVQYLADHFWSRWRTEYLYTLQKRTKWHSEGEIQKGDVALVKNEDSHRNQWPMGVVEKVFQSEDSKVRKTRVTVFRHGSRVFYVRPICHKPHRGFPKMETTGKLLMSRFLVVSSRFPFLGNRFFHPVPASEIALGSLSAYEYSLL